MIIRALKTNPVSMNQPLISTQKHSISINQWIQMIFNLNWMVIRKRVPIKKEDWIQWSRILHFAWLPVKQYRSDKHSMASVLLLGYWRDDSDDCNYIILHSECDGKFALEWTLLLAICLICNSHHSSRWAFGIVRITE